MRPNVDVLSYQVLGMALYDIVGQNIGRLHEFGRLSSSCLAVFDPIGP